MSPEEKKDLFQKLDETKKTIQRLRDSLNLIDSQKEQFFEKKESIGKEISALISEAKKSKDQRNSFTDHAKQAKDERQQLVTNLKDKIATLKKLRDQKEDILKKAKTDLDPRRLKQDIERLEFNLETTVMSFDKEQQLMKTIKDLKKKYNEVKDFGSANDQIRDLNHEIKELKFQAEAKHKEVQDTAKKSQEFHETVLSSGAKIEELKAQEEEAYKKFLEFKQQFNDVNSQLKEQLPVLNDINQKLNLAKEDTKKEKRHQIEDILKGKEEGVHEKLRKGQKLTTEDLLILQGRDEEN